MATSPTLARVLKGDLCAGCGACAAIAPEAVAMENDAKGFLRPVVTRAPTAGAEAQIAAVCPGVGLQQATGGTVNHELWGPLVSVRTGHATDAGLRFAAASGGVLSAVLVHLLDSGAVDFVLQTGPDSEDPVANRTVLCRTRDDVLAAAGSRYAPSAPLAGIEEHLAAGARFAFVGKPCDVAALRALARVDDRVDACIPYMISFFCAGVPSLEGARKVIARLGADPAEVTAFRYRGQGWPGRATATLADGDERSMTYHESWGGVLSSHVQFRCKICPDGVGGAADIACADAWICDAQGYPVFEEADGISLAITRTARGEALFAEAMAAGRVAAEPLDAGAIRAMQPGQFNRISVLVARLGALFALMRPRPRYRGYRLWAAARLARPLALARNFAGTFRRAAQRRS